MKITNDREIKHDLKVRKMFTRDRKRKQKEDRRSQRKLKERGGK